MSKTLRKVLVISGIIILVILLGLAGGFYYLNRNADSIVADLLEKEFEGSELSHVYDVSYDDISIGLISGSFKISNLKVAPKKTFFDAPDSLRIKYPMLFEVTVPRLKITGIDENFSLSLEEIRLKEISISGPSITIIKHLSEAEEKLAAASKDRPHKNATSGEGKIKQVLLDLLEINNGSLRYFHHKTQKEIASAGNVRLKTKDLNIAIDGEMHALVSRTFKDAQLSVGKIKYPILNGFYVIEVGKIENKTGSHDLAIFDFELNPQYDKLDFGKKFGMQTDRMLISLKELELKGFDVERFLSKEQVYINRIVVNGLYLNAFRDKNVPFDFNRNPKMPQQLLADLEMPLDIREIKITDSEVLYEQMSVDGSEPGQVPIKQLNGSVRNVSNVEQQIEENGPMTWDLNANFFGEGKLHLLVEFTKFLIEPDFAFSGSVQKMDMKVFNQMIEHTEFIRIESGVIQSMSFKAKANGEYVEGELLMLYDNLKIAGLRKISKKEKNELGLLSALANMVIRQFNPPHKNDDAPIESQIFFERDKNKGIFNYLAKGLVSGIKATILPSISSPKKRYFKELEKEEKKNAREQRKEERQKKRAALKAAKKK